MVNTDEYITQFCLKGFCKGCKLMTSLSKRKPFLLMIIIGYSYSLPVTCNFLGRASNPYLSGRYKFINDGSASIQNGTIPFTFHHVIPHSKWLLIITNGLYREGNNDLTLTQQTIIQNFIYALKYDIFQSSFDRESVKNILEKMQKNTLDNDVIMLDPTKKNDCSNSLVEIAKLFDYNGSNGFYGIAPEARSWDPKDGFDSWIQFFLDKGENDERYNLLKSLYGIINDPGNYANKNQTLLKAPVREVVQNKLEQLTKLYIVPVPFAENKWKANTKNNNLSTPIVGCPIEQLKYTRSSQTCEVN